MTRAELHDELASLLRLLPARGTFDEPEPVEDVPAFRPFSFLTTLADRVGELANGDGTNGDDEKPAAQRNSGCRWPSRPPSTSKMRPRAWVRHESAAG